MKCKGHFQNAHTKSSRLLKETEEQRLKRLHYDGYLCGWHLLGRPSRCTCDIDLGAATGAAHTEERTRRRTVRETCASVTRACVCVYVHAGVRTQRCFSLRMSYGKNFSKATTRRGERTTFFTALRCLEV